MTHTHNVELTCWEFEVIRMCIAKTAENMLDQAERDLEGEEAEVLISAALGLVELCQKLGKTLHTIVE